MSDLLLNGSITGIGQAIRSRKISVEEMAGWYLQRIASIDRTGTALNAVREIAPDAMAIARRLDDELAAGKSRGPLHGIPVLLKDNILTSDGLAATAGAAALLNFRPQREATLVRRLREAGAIILGKTNLTEFADYVSDVMPSGFSGAGGTVKNPHTGEGYGRGLGSSVGSAAAVAAALAPVAIGSETQNSIQAPAIASSVVGFKPSTGVISRAGIIPLVPSQDSPGPLARSVEDALLLTAILNGADCRDGAGMEWLLDFPSQLQGLSPSSLRIGVPRRAMADRADFEHVMPSFLSALRELRNARVTIVDPCDLPSAEQIQDVRSSVFRTEFRAALNVFLHDHAAPCGIDSIEALIRWNEAHPEAIPYGQSLLVAAQGTAGLDDPQYRDDRRRDIVLSREAGIDAAMKFAGVDALIAPMAAASKCTGKAGAPVLALPVGADTAGTPFGVTLYASRGGDLDLLKAGLTVFSIIGKRIVPGL
jgi:amidase